MSSICVPTSTLFRILPRELGNARVEALSGYMARLACLHHVRLLDLFRDIVLPQFVRHHNASDCKNHKTLLHNYGQIVPGINNTTEQLALLLEQLTGQDSLCALTMLPWRHVVSNRMLLRHTHAWCSACYEAQLDARRSEQSIAFVLYEPLLWTFQAVTVCPVHRISLQEQCPHCNRTFSRFQTIYHPGFCPCCRYCLGGAGKPTADPFALYAVGQVEMLLETLQPHASAPLRPNMAQVVWNCVKHCTGANQAAFSRLTHISTTSLNDIIQSKSLPQLQHLLQIGYVTGISLVQLLTTGEIEISAGTTTLNSKSYRPSRRTPRKIDTADVRALVSRLLEILPPLSSEEVVKRSGYDRKTLYVHAPDLIAQCVAKYQEYIKQERVLFEEGIKLHLLNELESTDDPPKSVRAVARDLGYKTHAPIYKMFPDLARRIARRHADFLHARAQTNNTSIANNVRKAIRDIRDEGLFPSKRRVSAKLGSSGIFKHPAAQAVWLEETSKLPKA